MVKKEFETKKGYLHIPVCSQEPETSKYIEVEIDGVCKNEFLIGISAPGEPVDFYVALDMKRYHSESIWLICRDESASDRLFDGVIEGGSIQSEPALYPNLYKEELRQRIHFSSARGWLNDPNGLFFKDGVFHMYYQHNPFANHHQATNVSWGHATTTDGVHFKEHGDAIMPRNSRLHIASGSALVDKHNISGMGENTVLAAYTDLSSTQYHGRPKVTTGGGQNLLFSTDGGMTYQYFKNNPIIRVPDGESWRDPKILQLDEKNLCIAVYETYHNQNCVSFYQSTDCIDWTFCSRSMDLYECPDLFPLHVVETDELLWVLYGGDGKYSVGNFENFEFKAIGSAGYLDYGDCVYAGQTFNNYDDPYIRRHLAWMVDKEWIWGCKQEAGPFKGVGFSQSMSLMCNLSLHKTNKGYRLFRTPIDNVETLRDNGEEIQIESEIHLPVPGELVFDLESGKNASVYIGGAGFQYDAQSGVITTTSEKKYEFSPEKEFTVRIISDTRSAEMFVGGEISMSFFAKPQQDALVIQVDSSVRAMVYRLKSIWES